MFFGRLACAPDEWGFHVLPERLTSYITISEEEHDRILDEATKQNKLISGDENGNPILVDPPPPAPEEIKRQRIKELERYLASTDWYVIRFADTGEAIPLEIKEARQSAREEISRLREE
jgi:hypothetical protein